MSPLLNQGKSLTTLGIIRNSRGDHVYADGHCHEGMEPYVRLTANDGDDLAMICLTAAQAQELATQLLVCAQFIEVTE